MERSFLRGRRVSSVLVWLLVAVVGFASSGAALADSFASTPTREVGPFISNQVAPAPAGGWQASDDRMIGPSIIGQQGWSGGAASCGSQKYDLEITHAAAHTGNQSLRLSNWYAASCIDSVISPAFAPVGETGSLTASSDVPSGNLVSYDFWFRSVSASADPGNDFITGLSGLASYRQTYLEAREEAPGDANSGCLDTSAGCFHLDAEDVVAGNCYNGACFPHHYSPDLVRGAWYHVVINATFVDGPLNDQVRTQVYDANGTQVWDVTTGSWEYAYANHVFGASPDHLAVDHVTFDMASPASRTRGPTPLLRGRRASMWMT